MSCYRMLQGKQQIKTMTLSQQRCYLDHNASTPLRDEAVQTMVQAAALVGNPSSVHGEGRAARDIIERAREQVAKLVGGQAKHVVFTSGATECANMALSPSLKPAAKGRERDAFLALKTEHLCVLEGHRFDEARLIDVDQNGIVDTNDLDEALEPTLSSLVAIQLANNETGVIQPVDDIADKVHARGGMVFCDAVQGAGKLPLDIGTLKTDLISLSAHKMGGPAGIGALVLASSDIVIDDRLIRGGGQERGWRAGTPNLVGIAGFGGACEQALQELEQEKMHLLKLREAFEASLIYAAPDAIIFGSGVRRLPNTSCFAIPQLKAETALIRFDLEGIALSSGSACSSGKVKASHVLKAMDVRDDLGPCALRISFGRNNTIQDVERVLMVLAAMRPKSKAA